MRFILFALILATACNQKKTDQDLFKEEKLGIDLSASAHMGYVPLQVDFTAYLETKERTVDKTINHVRWLIRGPNGYEREIIQDSQNFQEEEENERSFFYLEYSFNLPGKYSVQLFLNEGEYSSRKISVNAQDLPSENRSRF